MILFQPHLSGVSGDMLLGALLGLGADPNLLRRFEGFAHPDVRVTQVLLKTVPEGPLVTHSVDLVCEETETHRHPQEMEALLGETARYLEVSPQVHDQALRTLRVLIDAEAHAHGQPSEQVHLHEVGRFDTVEAEFRERVTKAKEALPSQTTRIDGFGAAFAAGWIISKLGRSDK